jgi:hypothetical protein
VSAPPDDRDRLALDAFSLALRVLYNTYQIEAPGTDFEKPWALLQEIAEGRTTLSNPAEMGAKYPHLRDFLYEQANRVVDRDRQVAAQVLRGLGQAF